MKSLIGLLAAVTSIVTLSLATGGAKEILKQAGAMTCGATPGDTELHQKVTHLECSLKIFGSSDSHAVTGKLYGSGLYLVEPGGIRVTWSVLSPTTNLRPDALAGTYDTRSEFAFEHVENNQNVLVGGMNDNVALELLAPALIDAINPSVRLTLVMGEVSFVGPLAPSAPSE